MSRLITDENEQQTWIDRAYAAEHDEYRDTATGAVSRFGRVLVIESTVGLRIEEFATVAAAKAAFRSAARG